MYCITKWCKSITDSGKDEYTDKAKVMKEKLMKDCGELPTLYKFRLLDDDGVIYAYGLSTENDTEEAFAPLDRYEPLYGCVCIEYKNTNTGVWEEL